MMAASDGNVRMVELLLKTGDSSKCGDIGGMTCVHYAVRNGHRELAIRLDEAAGGTILRNMEP